LQQYLEIHYIFVESASTPKTDRIRGTYEDNREWKSRKRKKRKGFLCSNFGLLYIYIYIYIYIERERERERENIYRGHDQFYNDNTMRDGRQQRAGAKGGGAGSGGRAQSGVLCVNYYEIVDTSVKAYYKTGI
jgi:hypothetical protein